MEASKEQINGGNYGIINNMKDPHLPCCLLKLWLRELPESLIPGERNYLAAIGAVSVEQRVEVLEAIPEENRAVIERLIEFLRTLVKPEVVAKTKMDVDNLAMIFAPCFLKCPSDDPIVVMECLEGESKFVRNLLIDRLSTN